VLIKVIIIQLKLKTCPAPETQPWQGMALTNHFWLVGHRASGEGHRILGILARLSWLQQIILHLGWTFLELQTAWRW